MGSFIRVAALQLILFFCYTSTSYADGTEYVDHVNTKVLVGSVTDNTVDVVVVFNIQDGWHIYAQNPGDTGMPTVFSFDDGEVKMHKVHWPEHSETQDEVDGKVMKSNVYSGTVAFPITLEVVEGTQRIKLRTSFSACGPLCIPQRRSLTVDLPAHGFEDGEVLAMINEWKEK
ncbi:MAG: protein-disulfide reductase DsbD domain-containing protein [Anaplasma sp.]